MHILRDEWQCARGWDSIETLIKDFFNYVFFNKNIKHECRMIVQPSPRETPYAYQGGSAQGWQTLLQ